MPLNTREQLIGKKHNFTALGLLLLIIAAGAVMCTGKTTVQPTIQSPTPFVLQLENLDIMTEEVNAAEENQLNWPHCVAVYPGDNDSKTVDTLEEGRLRINRRNGGGPILIDAYNPDGTLRFDNADAKDVEKMDKEGVTARSEACPDGVPFSSLDQ